MLVRIALLAVLLPLAACSPDEAQVVNDALEGTRWVEVTARQDTLSFGGLFEDESVVQLGRERRLRDGYTIPGVHAGPYSYEVIGEHIDLRWHLSSDSRSYNYPFGVEGKTLTIGNFYQSDLGDVLAFERLD